jgi:hypothetical protein
VVQRVDAFGATYLVTRSGDGARHMLQSTFDLLPPDLQWFMYRGGHAEFPNGQTIEGSHTIWTNRPHCSTCGPRMDAEGIRRGTDAMPPAVSPATLELVEEARRGAWRRTTARTLNQGLQYGGPALDGYFFVESYNQGDYATAFLQEYPAYVGGLVLVAGLSNPVGWGLIMFSASYALGNHIAPTVMDPLFDSGGRCRALDFTPMPDDWRPDYHLEGQTGPDISNGEGM